MYNMTIDFEKEGQYINVILETNKLLLTVKEVKTDSYVIKLDASLSGSGGGMIDLGQGPINIISMSFNNVKLTGTIVFNESDMSIKQLKPSLDGHLLIKINEIPNLTIPVPKIPIPFRANIDLFSDFTTPLTIIQFPLNVSNIWGVPSTNISIDGTIQSPWFSFINLVNNLARKPVC